MNAIALIKDEQLKQFQRYGSEHDDSEHADGSLADMAYAVLGYQVRPVAPPWVLREARHLEEKHGRDRIKMLTIAGALIASEIERINRHRERMAHAKPDQDVR